MNYGLSDDPKMAYYNNRKEMDDMKKNQLKGYLNWDTPEGMDK